MRRGRGGEVHPKHKDPTPLWELIVVQDTAAAEASFVLSDLCAPVHASGRGVAEWVLNFTSLL